MTLRQPPTDEQLLACLRARFTLTTRAVPLGDAEGAIKRGFATTYRKATEWLTELAFGSEIIIVSAAKGSDLITHEMQPDPTREFPFRWASLETGDHLPIIRIRHDGQPAGERDKAEVGRTWLLLRGNWERWVDNARAERDRQTRERHEQERDEYARMSAAHGPALGYLVGLLKAAGVDWDLFSDEFNDVRCHEQHGKPGTFVAELRMTGETIDKVAALLRERGIEPVDVHHVSGILMPLADWANVKKQVREVGAKARKNGIAVTPDLESQS